MKGHRFSDLFPLIDGDQFNVLVADIKANGLIRPITLYEGQVLDGRNCLRACEVVGIEPEFVEFGGDDDGALSFVMSENLARLHLDELQRAMAAAKRRNMRQGARTDLLDLGQICPKSRLREPPR